MPASRDRISSFKRKLPIAATWFAMALAWPSVCIFCLWSAGAIGHLTFLPAWLRAPLALVYLVGVIVLFFRTKTPNRWLSIVAASVVLVYLVTLLQRPSNERDWDALQEQTPHVDIANGAVTIVGFRHADYRSEQDFDVHYRKYRFELDQLKGVWFLVQKFSSLESLAHTMISFQLDSPDGPKFFSVSVEVRREKGEVYSPFRGLYRQYELLYVIGDERDLIGSRTVIREQDRVHMYKVNASPEEVQRLFLNVAERVNKLERSPEFYHTFLNNCTNGIVFHTYDLTPEPINWLDPRIVMPGYSDQFAFAKGLIGTPGQTFMDLQSQARIDQRAKRVGLDDEFSVRLRQTESP